MASRVLIFGAGGFVGGYLAREFAEHEYEVFGSDRADICTNEWLSDYAACDVTDSQSVLRLFERFKPKAVVNLAAISSVGASWKMPQATMRVNVEGALNILEAARAGHDEVKVLLVGSSEEYCPSSEPLSESSAVNANNPYGISKVAQEQFASVYTQRHGMRVYWTRSFNHTGVGQADSFVLPSWCKQVAQIERSGRAGILSVGNLDVRRDFSDVRDIVAGYRMLLESDYAGEPFNFGSGRALKLSDLAQFICTLSSQDIEVKIDKSLLRPVDNECICCNHAKATERLGWKPQYTIEATLTSMYEAYL